MNTLNLGSDEIPATKKKSNTRNLKIALGLAAVILVPSIGSTLAGNIAISSAAVEFGQGSVTAAACDSTMIITPTSTFTNTSGVGSFTVGTVVISGIADACSGRKFKLTAYGDTGTALALASGGASGNSCLGTYTMASVTNSVVSETSNLCVVSVGTYASNANVLTFTPAVGALASTSVYKFTLETNV